MKLKFSIQYGTAWGENIHVVITYRRKDGNQKRHKHQMNTTDGQQWTLETSVMESRHQHVVSFSYHYQVEDSNGNIVRKEWTMVPRTFAYDSTKDYIFNDWWREIPLNHHLYTNAYQTVVLGERDEETQALRIPLYRRTLLFVVHAPQLQKGQAVAVCGSHPAFGNWSTSHYLKMQYAGQKRWLLAVNVVDAMLPLEYKYVVVSETDGGFVSWEEGKNRALSTTLADGEVLVVDGDSLRVSEPLWRAAGVVVPVFSLRSEHSYGVGDFGDLRRFVDWASATGMKVIQILPINDTTKNRDWSDSYPYNSISVYALHPHYIDLEAAGVLKNKSLMNDYHRRRNELNNMPYSDYEAVDAVKMSYLDILFNEQWNDVKALKDYLSFVDDNEAWLQPYAEFCKKRDGKEATDIYYYQQYLLHVQLSEASAYARSKGIIIKGDIPIGVSSYSVETVLQPQYFNLDMQTGAPPDGFSVNGQNWSFPTYNWNAILKDNCQWWHSRLDQMSRYFDAFRIDHVLGFFRIWEIPSHAVNGMLGHFSPSLPLSVGEIEYFGLQFRKDFFTRPFINDNVLHKLFGVHASFVKDNYLIGKPYGMYELKSDYNTQRKVEACFAGHTDENSLWIRDGLYRLISNVLFVEDHQQADMYHPRISVYNETVFDSLGSDDKEAFMRLYNNYYYQRHNEFWASQALKRLPPMLENTRMLVCAEDLGMLPSCVNPVLDTFRILTLEIQTMPKESGVEFSHTAANPYRSVATISTHDMPPLALWWQENPERAQRYYATMLQKEGCAPDVLPANVAEEVVARHLYCPSMLCILSLQDWFAIDVSLHSPNVRDERINIPSNPNNKWKYRMPITIERLLSHDTYNNKLRMMINRSKR